MHHQFKKVLILGSWALKIGEAGEFDYSGSQAIKALREEGITIVLVNPNIATVQTNPDKSDVLYLVPITVEHVTTVIEKERPDGILLSFWWQTALNCGLALEEAGILKRYRVSVLGTPTATIRMTEDRKRFNEALDAIGVSYAQSGTANSLEEAVLIAEKIWYPVLVRAAYALGGLGSGFAHSYTDLVPLLQKAFAYSEQVILDESLVGWKELEYEVVRDSADNCITVCNMENIDPMGIHTGESIVVAPSQTLTDRDHQLLRDIALRTIRHLGIIGECNIQFALDPHSSRYCVVEVNARLSRSSALASKVTGYSLAYVAAKIALGYALDEIPNAITGTTTAFFEPSLDYVVVKIPRWDLEKFEKVEQRIGSEMKSVWEVMAIGRNIEEALQKAFRNLDIGVVWIVWNRFDEDFSHNHIDIPTPRRMLSIAQCLVHGMDIYSIHEKTGIDLFFLSKIENIVDTFHRLRGMWKTIDRDILLSAKKQWFADLQIARILWIQESEIRDFRNTYNILPKVQRIDTLAWEFPTETQYCYTTYHGIWSAWLKNHTSEWNVLAWTKKVLILWSGSYRIGSSVEFDWCSVSAIEALKDMGYTTIMLNYNPETVSTDYDISDILYFDEISIESVLALFAREKPIGVIISMGWQRANTLALALKHLWIRVLGTDPSDIDRAEDRHKFSSLLDTLHIDQPRWAELTSLHDALAFAEEQWYPVIIRPSYVLSGANMRLCNDQEQLTRFLETSHISEEYPTVISKFEVGAKEIEIDWVAQGGILKVYALSEHVENAGVHSWDATVIFPAQTLHIETIRRVKKIAKSIALALNITGPFNIQFLAKNDMIKVIECNLRASRSFPFISKVSGYNTIALATRAIMGEDITGDYTLLDLDHVGVKASQFSFHRLQWADPKLGIEMASTGEVGCIWETLYEALLLACESVGTTLQWKNILVTLGSIEEKAEFLSAAHTLISLGYTLYTTEWTGKIFAESGIPSVHVSKVHEPWENNILDLIDQRVFSLVINTPSHNFREEEGSGYMIRTRSVMRKIPLIVNVKLAKLFVKALAASREHSTSLASYQEFFRT